MTDFWQCYLKVTTAGQFSANSICSVYWKFVVSDIAIFVLKRDVKLQLTN